MQPEPLGHISKIDVLCLAGRCSIAKCATAAVRQPSGVSAVCSGRCATSAYLQASLTVAFMGLVAKVGTVSGCKPHRWNTSARIPSRMTRCRACGMPKFSARTTCRDMPPRVADERDNAVVVSLAAS
jgi:hypothetical protein